MLKNYLCAVAAVVAPAFGAEWMDDLEAAKARAAAEGKAVLVFFTGSNWCHYCARLREGILDTPVFAEYAADKFVLMEVDVPRGKAGFPQDLLQRNKRLCEQFKLRGFPTLLVLTPQGQVVGGMRGFRPHWEMVRQPLDEALANMQLLRRAEAAQGAERVALLRDVYEAVPVDLREASDLQEVLLREDEVMAAQLQAERAAEAQMQEIQARLQAVSYDEELFLEQLAHEIETALPANKAVLQDLQNRVETVAAFRRMNALHDRPAEALAYLDGKLAWAQGSLRTLLLGLKARLLLENAETVDDILMAKTVMLEVLEATPGDDALRRQVEEMYADPAALLEQVKRERR